MHRTRFIIAYLNENLGILISPCCTCTSMIDFFLFQSIIKLPWNIEKKKEWHLTKTSNTMVNVFISFSLKICYKYEHRKWVFAVFYDFNDKDVLFSFFECYKFVLYSNAVVMMQDFIICFFFQRSLSPVVIGEKNSIWLEFVWGQLRLLTYFVVI